MTSEHQGAACTARLSCLLHTFLLVTRSFQEFRIEILQRCVKMRWGEDAKLSHRKPLLFNCDKGDGGNNRHWLCHRGQKIETAVVRKSGAIPPWHSGRHSGPLSGPLSVAGSRICLQVMYCARLHYGIPRCVFVGFQNCKYRI
jgi:hypothetical protein